MPKSFRIPLFAAVVLWMAVIFAFSMETAAESSHSSGTFIRTLFETFDRDFSVLSSAEQTGIIESWSFAVRKAAHFSVFCVLGILTASAVSTFRFSRRKTALLSLAVCAAYAVSDEVHQYFVPGRACAVRDMLIDTCGAAFGILLVFFFIYIIRKIRNSSI